MSTAPPRQRPVEAPEYAAIEAALASRSPVDTGYVREDFDRTGIDWRPVTGEHDLFVKIVPAHISGRRIRSR